MKPPIGVDTKDFARELLDLGLLLDRFEQREKPWEKRLEGSLSNGQGLGSKLYLECPSSLVTS
jgi:hypothetical protein